MMKYLKLIRVKHYIKNFLIFLPLIFGGYYTNINNLLVTFIGLLLFSFISSIVYVINDINDIEKDRLHETKKFRPLASGQITIKKAYLTIVVLVILSIILFTVLYYLKCHIVVLLLPILYVVINYAYSKKLKNIVLVDVIILVIGFLIRLFFGAGLIDAYVSNWLYLTVMSGAFFMGFGKRRNEILRTKNNTRNVLSEYNKEFLDKSMYVSLTLAIVFYSMWTVDAKVIERLNSDYLIWSVPLLLIILFQYSLIIEKDSDGDPVEVILKNKTLLLTIAIYVIFIIVVLL